MEEKGIPKVQDPLHIHGSPSSGVNHGLCKVKGDSVFQRNDHAQGLDQDDGGGELGMRTVIVKRKKTGEIRSEKRINDVRSEGHLRVFSNCKRAGPKVGKR